MTFWISISIVLFLVVVVSVVGPFVGIYGDVKKKETKENLGGKA